jgi:hypothetical protein
VSDPLRVNRLKSKCFNLGLKLVFESSMKMDEHFIVISTFQKATTKFTIFLKKTLDLHGQMTINRKDKKNFVYSNGLLLAYVKRRKNKSEYSAIEVYDVTSRKCIREMRSAKYDSDELKHMVGFNSKFMVVTERSHDQQQYMNIYDLEAVKNPKRTQDELLVHRLAVNFHFDGIAVTETEIFSQDWYKIRIIDFSSLNVIRNATKSVTLSSPWRGLWRSKGVDEEPLEPTRHMEVYKEVLKYFDELSTNCQTAIKRCPVVNPDTTSFNLGDDFIDYRSLRPLVTYQNYKSVQISENVKVSVRGKTIHLIHVPSNHVINEMKLQRDAIGFHFNRKLLVFVSKISENEHLLSVWRVENPLNVTRIKDVSIGDYDPNARKDSVELDEQFIAVRSPRKQEDDKTTFNFISLKTFQVERSLSGYFKTSYYDGGYLFLITKDCLVRMLDVASGTFLHDIRMKPFKFGYIFRVNSNYVVIATITNLHSTLYVYDLKRLKETHVVPTYLLLTKIELKQKVERMAMNETRIVCLSYDQMYVVDLKPIGRLRCPESC